MKFVLLWQQWFIDMNYSFIYRIGLTMQLSCIIGLVIIDYVYLLWNLFCKTCTIYFHHTCSWGLLLYDSNLNYYRTENHKWTLIQIYYDWDNRVMVMHQKCTSYHKIMNYAIVIILSNYSTMTSYINRPITVITTVLTDQPSYYYIKHRVSMM